MAQVAGARQYDLQTPLKAGKFTPMGLGLNQ
jgi:hypothetical protein